MKTALFSWKWRTRIVYLATAVVVGMGRDLLKGDIVKFVVVVIFTCIIGILTEMLVTWLMKKYSLDRITKLTLVVTREADTGKAPLEAPDGSGDLDTRGLS